MYLFFKAGDQELVSLAQGGVGGGGGGGATTDWIMFRRVF